MFDNRWENWSGDFSDTFAAGLLDPSVRTYVPEILAHFAREVRRIDRNFPDEVSPGTFAAVMSGPMARLTLPDPARAHVAEVIARFLEYLRESGRVGEGDDWAAQVRAIGPPSGAAKPGKPAGGVKGVPIRKPAGVSAVGRNDPCPCGSGKKYKKCCLNDF